MKKIGLVGGISWTSTEDYYRYINKGVNEKLGGLNFAECIIYSLNFGEIQERSWEGSYELLLNASKKLEKIGVDAIVLCANTAHLFADKIQKEINSPIIHIVKETANSISQQGLTKVGLLGTIFTMEQNFYREKLEEKGITVLVPELQQTRDLIQHIVKEELGKGIVKKESKDIFLSIANTMIKKGAEGIILGCTEIPLLINQEDFMVPVFNTTKIHSQAIVEFAVS
ncbi:aspartate racemase [Flagellimonas aquimarina]|uniref:Aspartate racemase n=1 Tax=Flagellimonas aquimarina TaxID=2201895 RepID=A0A316L0U4_9FLAO|nr:aspartate/glutamate racemase family protein [Allomuricauda koreensis]PWL38938.1 aspartate racemase [Allomuricauda koreensis]